jgi:hypothetical protein
MAKAIWVQSGTAQYAMVAGFKLSVGWTKLGWAVAIDGNILNPSRYDDAEQAKAAAEYVLAEWCKQALRELAPSDQP